MPRVAPLADSAQSYLELKPTMKTFVTGHNSCFGVDPVNLLKQAGYVTGCDRRPIDHGVSKKEWGVDRFVRLRALKGGMHTLRMSREYSSWRSGVLQ
jgi:hypothetical protein